MSRSSTALITTPIKALQSLNPGTSKPATREADIPPSPGAFRHPQLTEIIQRRSASSLTTQKIQNATINVVAFAVTFIFDSVLRDLISRCLTLASIPSSALDANILIQLFRLLFLANTILCLRPVLPYISQKDDITDIPLTPSQRALLGLPPSVQSSPVTASGSLNYVTPPRYRRDGGVNTASSLQNSPLAFSAGRRSVSANYASSPLSTPRYTLGNSPFSQQTPNQSSRTYTGLSESSFSRSPNGSPMLHRAATNEITQSVLGGGAGRTSFGTSTSSYNLGLSRSHSLRERNGELIDVGRSPSTPSPSGPKRQPGMNYKWLYDKGARLPRSESTGF